MTPNEIAAVAAVIRGVDGSCYLCAARASCELTKLMPWIDWPEAISLASIEKLGSAGWTADSIRDASPCGHEELTSVARGVSDAEDGWVGE